MKLINFMQARKPAEQKALAQWKFVSMFMVGAAVSGIIGAHGLQVYQWYTLSREHAQLQAAISRVQPHLQLYQGLQQEREVLQKRKQKCDRKGSSLMRIQQMLTACKSTLSNYTLHSYTWSKGDIELVLASSQMVHAADCLSKVRSINGFQSARLVSLHQPRQTEVFATLRVQSTSKRTKSK